MVAALRNNKTLKYLNLSNNLISNKRTHSIANLILKRPLQNEGNFIGTRQNEGLAGFLPSTFFIFSLVFN